MKIHEYNPDCGYAWLVVFACFVINFIMTGLARVAGVLYIALIEEYAVSRELATAPFSVRFCVRNMSGPIVGVLGQRFGVRPIVLLGGLVCGIGGIICSIAPDITWITTAWGGLHGLGYGMCSIIHVIAINRYFHKYKGLAVGISLTGDCFGTFLLPVLLESLLSAYGLKGTFLILAGISLNVVPAAMILKSPPWEEKNGNHKLHTENCSELNVEYSSSSGLDNKAFEFTQDDIAFRNKNKYSNQQLQRGIILNDVESYPVFLGKPTVEYLCKNVIADQLFLTHRPKQQTNNSFETPIVIDKTHAQIIENSVVLNSSQLNLSNSSEIQKNFTISNVHSDTKFLNSSPLGKTIEPIRHGMSTEPEKENVFKRILKTNLKPIFLLICADLALYTFLFIAVFTILIDYVSDNNIPTKYGTFLIIAFSVTDLFGRIGFGFVLDKQWIALSSYAGLTTGLMGLFIFIIPFSKSFMFWITSFSVCGFIQGGVAIRYPKLVDNYMEKNEETVALGCLTFYGGLLMLPIPPMVGYFRDIVGSYDGVFWTTCGLCIFAGCLWLLEPCIVRKQQNKKETFVKHCDKGQSQIM